MVHRIRGCVWVDDKSNVLVAWGNKRVLDAMERAVEESRARRTQITEFLCSSLRISRVSILSGQFRYLIPAASPGPAQFFAY